MTQSKRLYAVVSIALFCFAITVCDLGPDGPVPLTYEEAVKKVTFTGDVATVGFTNLNLHDIYLVMINSSNSTVPSAGTGGVAQALSVIASDRSRSVGFSADIVSFRVGDKKSFWVERNIRGGNWEQRPATLMAAGEHGNIWVMEANTSSGTSENKISTEQAEELVGKFDLIYPLTTNLLGYEYGGGEDGDGGMDLDKKIQILVYDFYEPGYGAGGTQYTGYFYYKDFYTQAELEIKNWSDKTNMAEMFYINANSLINSPDFIYSTLIHEFQHMINFNRKLVVHNENSSTWYNEMLSMMAEDVIAPLIGIGHTHPSHPISRRIPVFLDLYYRYGIIEWNNSNNNYANVYAFGAYLLRNYGGPELLKRLLDNDKVDLESITLALEEFSEGMDFTQALNRYGEALIFSGPLMPNGAASFDRTVTSTVNGQVYTAYGFDIWQMSRREASGLGPLVLGFEGASMRPLSMIVRSDGQWKGKTGDFSITLKKPSNQNVILYLMAR
jgi:hypothetical protein